MRQFHEAFKNRYNLARQWKEREGKRVIGWVCTYFPEEIVYAADMLPIRILGGREEIIRADAYLYPNICSFVRSCLEEGLRGKYDFIDGIVTANTCDFIGRLGDCWHRFLSTSFHHTISIPTKTTSHAIDFFKFQLIQFKRTLEDYFKVEITDESLRNAIRVYNRTRLLLKELYQLRKVDPPPITGAQVLEVVLAGMAIPKDKYNQMLGDLLKYIYQQNGEDLKGRIRLMIMGSELDDPEFLRNIEDLGGVIVTDDLCNGSRYFWDLVDTEAEPMDALARRYLIRTPCPRMYPPKIRLNILKEKIKEYNVDGVIYEVIKFCDMHGVSYPMVKKELDELQIPMLALDREYAMTGMGQIKTRIQAFFESIEITGIIRDYEG